MKKKSKVNCFGAKPRKLKPRSHAKYENNKQYLNSTVPVNYSLRCRNMTLNIWNYSSSEHWTQHMLAVLTLLTLRFPYWRIIFKTITLFSKMLWAVC